MFLVTITTRTMLGPTSVIVPAVLVGVPVLASNPSFSRAPVPVAVPTPCPSPLPVAVPVPVGVIEASSTTCSSGAGV